MTQATHQALGAALLARRNALGLTAETVAQALAISADQLGTIERGQLAPEPELLVRLAAHYGIAPQATADVNHLLAQFLQQDSPSRGQLFKDFVSSFKPKA